MSASILSIQNITVETRRRGERVLLVDNVSLDVRRGSVLALVGASGSGKSMTFAASLDVLPPGVSRTGGQVCIDGAALPVRSLRGHQIAVIMQNPRSAFNPVRSMRDQAFETFRALDVPRAAWEPRIIAAMEEAGLEDPAHILGLHPFRMSGGMLQRMMIALALASGSPFLLADEPTTDLDLIVQRDILDVLDRLRAERDLGVLLITHDMSVVARLADNVAVMDAGKIVEYGPVDQICTRPAHAATRRLVDAHLSLYGLEANR